MISGRADDQNRVPALCASAADHEGTPSRDGAGLPSHRALDAGIAKKGTNPAQDDNAAAGNGGHANPAGFSVTPLPLIACPGCDTLHQRVDPGRGGKAMCRCCGHELYRRGKLTPAQWVPLTWFCLIVFGIAQWFPIAQVNLQGQTNVVTFWQALRLCWDQGHYDVSIMTGLAGFWLPLLRIVLTVWALQTIVNRRLPPDLVPALNWLRRLGPWAMVSVLVLAILVAFVKLADLAHVQLGHGLIGFMLLSFCLAGLSRWNAEALWRLAEDNGMVAVSGSQGRGIACTNCAYVQAPADDHRCRRCHLRLVHRRGKSSAYVWAPLLAAAILYVPANVLPVMQVQTLVGSSEHTILGGVIELWQLGSWDLAIIVFSASVMIPVGKIFALVFLLLQNRPRGPYVQRQRTRMYTVVEFIGQWSMLDVFVVVLLAAMVDFPGLSRIMVGPAAFSFGLVVIFTMIAAMHFDPRRGWDALRGQAT